MKLTAAIVTIFNCLFFISVCQAENTLEDNFGLGELRYSAMDVLGKKGSAFFEGLIDIQAPVTWSTYTPKNYTPVKPSGLVVFISPTNDGSLPNSWLRVMEQHNLIWIGAHNSGNEIITKERIGYAMLGLFAAKKRFSIDDSKTYIAGYSGGGRVASMIATQFPDLFNGAMYFNGVDKWSKLSEQNLNKIKRNRYVFITGDNDFNLSGTKRVYKHYRKSGVKDSLFIKIRGASHQLTGAKVFDQAITFVGNIAD